MSSVEDVVLAAAACVILAKQRTPRRYWVRPSLKARAKYNGSELFKDLNRNDIEPLSGQLRFDGGLKIVFDVFNVLNTIVALQHKFTSNVYNFL